MHSFQKIQENFKRLVEKDGLSHAYLLFGSGAGSGAARRELARAVARELEARSMKYEASKSFDSAEDGRPLAEFLEIAPDEKKTIGIDAVRGVEGFLYGRPVFSSRRTVFIDSAEAMTPEAQNAILKIVEEPPAWGLVLISASNEENLLPTLRSRLQKIHVSGGKAGSYKAEVKAKTLQDILEEKIIDEKDVEAFFEHILSELDKRPLDNVKYMKAVLSRLQVIKALNTNIRLQLRALAEALRK